MTTLLSSAADADIPGFVFNIQVPVLLALVYVALWLHSRLKWALPQQEPAAAPPASKAADVTQ